MNILARLAVAGASLTLVVALGLVASQNALAAGRDHPTVALTASAQAQAKSIGLVLNDLGGSGWTGGPVTSDPASDTPSCANFDPKQSDLAVTGSYESSFEHTSGLSFDASVEVFRTPQMVALDWTRTAASPLLIGCLGQLLRKSVPGFVSVRRVTVPRVGDASAMYRILERNAAGTKEFVDVIVVAKGKTEITLTSSAPFAQVAVVQSAELRLAGRLAQRDAG